MRSKRLVLGLLIVTLLALLFLPGIVTASPSASDDADKATPAVKPLQPTRKPLLKAPERVTKALLEPGPGRSTKPLLEAGPGRSTKPLDSPQEPAVTK
jgi:hypothetical protein